MEKNVTLAIVMARGLRLAKTWLACVDDHDGDGAGGGAFSVEVVEYWEAMEYREALWIRKRQCTEGEAEAESEV